MNYFPSKQYIRNVIETFYKKKFSLKTHILTLTSYQGLVSIIYNHNCKLFNLTLDALLLGEQFWELLCP